tara:strand:+ start:326 stop:652 length:327 start_codon:yes stop_codon:yes gene_type:complete
MTIYDEMQALKDSVDKLRKQLEEIKEELREQIQDDIVTSIRFTDAVRDEVYNLEYKDEEIILLLGVLVNKVDEISEHTMISLRERQLMDSINKRADQIRTARKKKKWR